jgi:hypothetical protein
MKNITTRIDEYIAANKESNDIPGYKIQKPHPACNTCEFFNYNGDCSNPQNERDALKLAKKNKLDYIVMQVWPEGICPRYKSI